MTMYAVLTMFPLANIINVTKKSSLLEKRENKHTKTSHVNGTLLLWQKDARRDYIATNQRRTRIVICFYCSLLYIFW